MERFIADFMLGRLAKWLRIYGYDTEYFRGENRRELLLKSIKEQRTVLTRDHRLSIKRAWKLILIKSDFLEEQLRQVINELGLITNTDNLFSRCTLCNTPIEQINKTEVMNKVPPYIYATQNEFSYCPQCKKIYWQGTHLRLLQEYLKKFHHHNG